MGLYTVEAENTSIKGQIAIEKLGETRYWDEETKEFKTSTAPLENIEFGIYAKEDILSADGQGDVVFAKDELVETVKTNDEGYAASSKNLLPGTYIVKELNTPEEFISMQDEPSSSVLLAVLRSQIIPSFANKIELNQRH